MMSDETEEAQNTFKRFTMNRTEQFEQDLHWKCARCKRVACNPTALCVLTYAQLIMNDSIAKVIVRSAGLRSN